MADVAAELAVRAFLVGKFPGLAQTPFEVTSDPTPIYNCIAWAAGDQQSFWWPGHGSGYFWPPSVPRAVTRDAFIRAFGRLRYRVCLSPDLEDGDEKVALYEFGGEPTHAARLMPDGRWSSKLGQSHDIAHSLDALNGDEYGAPVIFLRRPIIA